MIESISKEQRIVLGADLNGHVGKGNIGDEEIMGRYGVGTRNKEELMVVDFGEKNGFGDCQYLFQEERRTQGDV